MILNYTLNIGKHWSDCLPVEWVLVAFFGLAVFMHEIVLFLEYISISSIIRLFLGK
jgi:hypothetical protein